jgi:hypothetical protein
MIMMDYVAITTLSRVIADYSTDEKSCRDTIGAGGLVHEDRRILQQVGHRDTW